MFIPYYGELILVLLTCLCCCVCVLAHGCVRMAALFLVTQQHQQHQLTLFSFVIHILNESTQCRPPSDHLVGFYVLFCPSGNPSTPHYHPPHTLPTTLHPQPSVITPTFTLTSYTARDCYIITKREGISFDWKW